MELTILGCYSATPRINTNPTAQVLNIRNHLFLIDCGEGTQIQLRRNKIKFSRIRHVFISHLHGDHYFGLIGLISTFTLLRREAELHIYGPKGIKEIILLQLKLGKSWVPYPLYFHELESKDSQLVLEDEKVSVQTIPLKHRIYTNGFLFKEKEGDRKLNITAVKKANIDVSYYQKIKLGFDVKNANGEVFDNKDLTLKPDPSKSYAYCSDTMYFPDCVQQITNSTVLYHESTFLNEHSKLAKSTRHSTAAQAATIAKDAQVGLLILGHYSTRYSDVKLFKEEAKTIFGNVELAEEGKTFKL